MAMWKPVAPPEKGAPDIIVSSFKSLHLPGMLRAYQNQLQAGSDIAEKSFDERLQAIVEEELESRATSSLTRRLKDARLLNPMACVEQIADMPERKLDKLLMQKLATCSFVQEKRHISFEGATGTGKTFMACALGNAACREGYRVRSVRLADILNEMTYARRQGDATKVRNYYMKYDVLILDDWLLCPVVMEQAVELLELVEAFSGKGSLIFCTQYPNKEWYGRIDVDRPEGGSSTLAEAILDRIIHHMFVVTIESDVSMRKHYTSTGVPISNTDNKKGA